MRATGLQFRTDFIGRLIPFVLAISIFTGGPVMAAEELPRYKVIESLGGDAEIRLYAQMILAETDVTGSRSAASSKGFRILAAYIFGKNKKQEEIEMTAPVTQAPPSDADTENEADSSEKIEMTAPVTQVPNGQSGSNAWTVTFLMPARYTMETLPQPIDDRVRIREVPEHRAVVLRFSGRLTDKNMQKHRKELDELIAAKGLKTTGNEIYAYYNGPMTPFFLRRNEVMYNLLDEKASED